MAEFCNAETVTGWVNDRPPSVERVARISRWVLKTITSVPFGRTSGCQPVPAIGSMNAGSLHMSPPSFDQFTASAGVSPTASVHTT